ncbi:SufE family protein [Alteromonas facilis]|uniref:SufE family protein n=1 Tax=Alteromonas facilis TaxID=2048004 RepID=UPI000F5C8308|nr:SufE family protein [Alteromonas facilis]
MPDKHLPLATAIHASRAWDSMFRQIMLAGKQMRPLDESQQIDENKVVGCEAAVWLVVDINAQGSKSYHAYSPSKIVRGLLAIILEKANSLTGSEQATFDYQQYLSDIGLSRFLSPSRQNGLAAVIKRIQTETN